MTQSPTSPPSLPPSEEKDGRGSSKVVSEGVQGVDADMVGLDVRQEGLVDNGAILNEISHGLIRVGRGRETVPGHLELKEPS